MRGRHSCVWSSYTQSSPEIALWREVRDAFPLDREYTHFAGFLLASHPLPVDVEIDRHRQALDANPAMYLRHMRELSADDPMRRSAADFLRVPEQAEQIALTDSTAMGLGLVYSGVTHLPGRRPPSVHMETCPQAP